MTTFRDGLPLPTEAQVRDIEQRLEVSFPPDYRDFLLAWNGGQPDPAWFNEPPELPDADVDYVESFLSVCPQRPTPGSMGDDLESVAVVYRRDLWLPPEFLPVGVTGGGGGTILLRVAGPRYGAVAGWWAHDTGYPGGTLVDLSESWRGFLSSLRDEAVVRAEAQGRREGD